MPGKVTLPVTGHVLDLPVPGETLIPYIIRVAYQAGYPREMSNVALGGSVMGQDSRALFGPSFNNDDQSTWPAAVDKLCNRDAYETAAERDYRERLEQRDRDAAAASRVMQPGQMFDIRTLSVEDLKFLKANHQALQGVVGPTYDRNAFINWTYSQGGHAPNEAAEAAAAELRGHEYVDVSGYNGPLKQFV